MAIDIGTLDTFPKLLMHHARLRGAKPAIREKDLGIWQTWTWSKVRDEVAAVAAGLAAGGLAGRAPSARARGPHTPAPAPTPPRLYVPLIAAQAVGAIPVPFYEDAVAQEM